MTCNANIKNKIMQKSKELHKHKLIQKMLTAQLPLLGVMTSDLSSFTGQKQQLRPLVSTNDHLTTRLIRQDEIKLI